MDRPTLDNWMRPPHPFWSFRHVRELIPTSRIRHGRHPRALPFEAVGDLLDGFGRVDGPLRPPEQGRQGAQLAHVAFDRALHLRILQLHRQGPPVQRRRPVDLAQRGRMGGVRLEDNYLMTSSGPQDLFSYSWAL